LWSERHSSRDERKAIPTRTGRRGTEFVEQHEELKEWVGDDYDPDAFSIKDVNRMLTPLRRRRGNTSHGRAPAR
jgi:hypothetical protein